jgi:four helix bundle protein
VSGKRGTGSGKREAGSGRRESRKKDPWHAALIGGTRLNLSSWQMRSHHSLDAWKVVREVSLLAIQAARRHWKPRASALFSQVLRSSLSVQSNIAEGATFGRSPSYTRHLAIAFGSAVETGELIELLRDAEVIPTDMAVELASRSARSQQLLIGLLKIHRPMY